MVISFQNEKVRKFLIEHGEVFTFRKKERKNIGYDWMNEGRGKPKLFNVNIEYAGFKTSIWELDPYLELSGFDTLEEWWDTLRELNNGKLPFTGHLYHVELYLSQEEAIEMGIA